MLKLHESTDRSLQIAISDRIFGVRRDGNVGDFLDCPVGRVKRSR